MPKVDKEGTLASHRYVGRLAWFREPPGIGALVRIDDVIIRDGQMKVGFVVLATVDRPYGLPLRLGQRHQVGAGEEEWVNITWRIFPLAATDIDEGIAEIGRRYCHAPVTWLR